VTLEARCPGLVKFEELGVERDFKDCGETKWLLTHEKKKSGIESKGSGQRLYDWLAPFPKDWLGGLVALIPKSLDAMDMKN
jgi:hypothetical protein